MKYSLFEPLKFSIEIFTIDIFSRKYPKWRIPIETFYGNQWIAAKLATTGIEPASLWLLSEHSTTAPRE